MTTATRLTSSRTHRLLAMLVGVALLAPILGPAAGYDMWAWFPDHGHASVTPLTPPHVHPWDTVAEGAPVASTAGNLLDAPVLPVMLLAVLTLPAVAAHFVRRPRVEAPRSHRPQPDRRPPRACTRRPMTVGSRGDV